MNHSSGNATGTVDANNAQTLRDNACTVAGYFGFTDNLVISITGPDEACPLETVCFFANVGGAPGPYTYQWSWTLNGVSYTNFGTGSSACLNMFNFTPPDLITIRLQVTAPGQPMRTTYHDVNLVQSNQILCPEFKAPAQGTSDDLVQSSNGLDIFPNPASLRSDVRLQLAQDGPVELAIYDLNGQKIADIAQGRFVAGNHQFAVDVTEIPAGIYLLSGQANGERLNKRFAITH